MKPVPFKTAKDYVAPKWAFMKRRLIGSEDSVYLDRMYVLVTPLFSIMFHRIFRPDKQRDLHDHPWNFISFVLRGRYTESVPCEGCAQHFETDHYAIRTVRWINVKKAEDRHSIREVSRVPVWTLVFTGPKKRTWGFWVDGGTKWVKWTEYDKVDQP